MENFVYYNPAKIIFGKGVENHVGEHVAQFGKKVLLHYGGGSIKKNGLYDRVVASLKANKIAYIELGGAQPNPRLSLVREGIALCKREGVDFILAVGGGSVIDSAKAIAMGTRTDGDVWDFFMGKTPIAALAIGVVLTIPAAGSESSDSCVITNDTNGYKRATSGDIIIPKFAIMNPEVTYSMPKYQIACGASDILAHLFERYFTLVENVDFTDRLLEATMRTILLHAPKAIKTPNDYKVRAEIMWAGTVAHNNLLDTGRIGDWASHSIEHELSGMYDIAHGAGLSIVFPAWMKYVKKTNINKFVQLAVRVFGVDVDFNDSEDVFNEMILKLENWYKSMGLPTRLSDIDITEKDFDKMATICMDARGQIGCFKVLKKQDVINIYKLAL